MERKKNVDGDMQFAAVLCTLLGEHWQTGGGGPHLFRAKAAESHAAVLQEEKHTAMLRFEGALTGHCVLACPESSAALLGAREEANQDADSLLRNALAAACEPLSAALFAHYGSVRVHLVEDGLTVPADAEAIANLVAQRTETQQGAKQQEEAEAYLVLYADGELQRGLLRLARVAAAAEASGIMSGNLGLVMDVELEVTLRFGQRQLSLREVMDLTSGSVVELDREVDEPVELILDGRVIARGEAVIVDGNYGVRVTEVLQPMVL